MANVDGTDETLEAAPTASGEGGARPQLELHELGAGDVIGRYQITGVLGAGGMGRVYRARDPDLNRDLAIKVLRRAPGSGGSGGLEHRLLREAQAMARLKHANLATVYDVGSMRGEVFIAFEFIDGQTLASWMRAPGRTTDEKLAALVAAGRGLEAAHSAGVIHRDFKPDNVLVANDGDVKVVDFGLARGVEGATDAIASTSAQRNDALSTDLTMTGSLLGTPAYMAPEQHKGVASDARADQFGFAVSAWEALYGERPFKGKSLESIAAAILGGEITPPPAGANVRPHIEKALRRAMSVDPAARFANIGELLDVLAPTSAPAAEAAPARRSRDKKLAAAIVGVGLVGAGVIQVVTRDDSKPPQSLPPPPPSPPAPPSSMLPPDTARVSVEGEGDLNRDSIRASIRTQIGKVTGCYESALLADPLLGAGTVSIKFVIAGDGTVKETDIAGDTFEGRGGVARCVAANTFTWKFPPPAGGGKVEVSYPFTFRPTAAADPDSPDVPPAPPRAP